MFAPIIAYLILFNDYAIEFIDQIRLNIEPSSDANWAQSPDLYFIYYGLLSIGVASIFYALFAPSSVRQFDDAMQFSKEVKLTGSRTTQMSYFDQVLGAYVEETRGQESRFWKGTLHYPSHLESASTTLVVEVFKRYNELNRDEDAEDEPGDSDEEDGWREFHEGFYTGSGYLDAHAIADRAFAAPKVIWAFSEPYRAAALDHFPADIASVKYELDNNSRPTLRFVVAILYAAGFALLLVPSARAFASISIGLFLPEPVDLGQP